MLDIGIYIVNDAKKYLFYRLKHGIIFGYIIYRQATNRKRIAHRGPNSELQK